MFIHVQVPIVQMNVHVSLWNMHGTPYACVHVYLHIALMLISTNNHVSLQMTGKPPVV